MKHAGTGYVPPDRKLDGLVLSLSVAQNISLSGGDDMFSSKIGWWNRSLERSVAKEFVQRLDIKTQSIDKPCATLSGGNQQKVVLARWLCRSLCVLLLDNPTRGIDTGAKAELYRVFRDLVRNGMTIILISDDLPEVIQMSDRIAVMAHGRMIETLEAAPGAKPDEEQIVSIMLRSGDEIAPPNGVASY
jgi:ribose transport system ATP-binding protein